MRIMGMRETGEICVYEVVGFRYYKPDNMINCTITDGCTMHIQGKNQSITETMSKAYSNELFNTGKLNLVEEDVIISLSKYTLSVHVKSHEWNAGIPVYLTGHNLTDRETLPIDIVRRSY